MATSDEWRNKAKSLAETCRQHLPDLVAVYVHGSAAQGTLTPASDLDVLALATEGAGLDGLSRSLLAEERARPVELSVVRTVDAALPRPPWPYLLHVNTALQRSVMDDGRGDPDLVAHYAMTRACGVAIVGPPPERTIGNVDRGDLLTYLKSELYWAAESADQRYAVLNGCRAVAYARTGVLTSKIAGAQWWSDTFGPHPLVQQALDAQLAGSSIGEPDERARSFLAECIHSLT